MLVFPFLCTDPVYEYVHGSVDKEKTNLASSVATVRSQDSMAPTCGNVTFRCSVVGLVFAGHLVAKCSLGSQMVSCDLPDEQRAPTRRFIAVELSAIAANSIFCDEINLFDSTRTGLLSKLGHEIQHGHEHDLWNSNLLKTCKMLASECKIEINLMPDLRGDRVAA